MSAERPFKWTRFSITAQKSVFKTLALRRCHLLHPKPSSLFIDPRNVVSNANHRASLRSNSNRPPLTHHSQGQPKENHGIILDFLLFILH